MSELLLEKTELIFEICEKRFSDYHLGWAQGPQSIQIGDFRRIFFSTRFTDTAGYVFSEVRFIDFDLTLTKRLSEPSDSVINRSAPGSFDEDGIFPLHPIQESLVGAARFQAFTCGWQRKSSVDIDMKVGLVETKDGGISFERIFKGPIMGPTPVEPFLIGDPSAIYANGKFFVYYIFGTDWVVSGDNIPEREYKIGVAEFNPKNSEIHSRVGAQIIANRISIEAQAMPSVVFFEGVFHMFYCFRSVFDFRTNPKAGYRLAHAFSDDGIHWSNSDSLFLKSSSAWDEEMQCYPSAYIHEDYVYVLYNGNQFGKSGFGSLKIEGRTLNEYSRLQRGSK